MKYYLQCVQCNHITPDFKAWFAQNQVCPVCGNKHSEAWYEDDPNYTKLPALLEDADTYKGVFKNTFWRYFDYLPLRDSTHVVSLNEGAVPIEQWAFLEDYARSQYHIDLQVYVCRNDLNGGTGTFKDIAASLAASVLRENGVEQYCVASTGNTATAYGRYLALAGINASIFIPEDALQVSEASISAYGQQALRAHGDYAKAKEIAGQYAQKYQVLISTGNIDPLRVEAKKTMVFEWLRQLKRIPDVYIQAVSGGTGPIAVDKGMREVQKHKNYAALQMPRLIMVQPDGCDPMTTAWETAQKQGFQDGFEKQYPIIPNPQTSIPTLATGNPATYPIVAKLVQKTNGAFLRMHERKLADYGKLVAFERNVLLGPASAVCVAGFFESLQKGLLHNGEMVLLNIGEGIGRAPDFLNQLKATSSLIDSVEQCKPHTKSALRQALWQAIQN
ncbi:threonine synthase [Bacteroidia bacterium]|nr:threonine synthase [Bacteroidia bacterium]